MSQASSPTSSSTLIYYIATTLDGFIAHDDGSYEGFLETGGHVAQFLQFIERSSAVLMGRHTYEVGLRMGLPLGQPAYPGRPNYIFSNTLPEVTHPHEACHIIRSDAASYVADLKQQLSGVLWLCGGGVLATSLLNAGLVDELHLKINPILFSRGRPVVGRLDPRVTLTCMGAQVHENGVVVERLKVGMAPLQVRADGM